MIKVNLVPPEILAKAHQKQQIFQATVAGVALAVVVALVSLGHVFRLQRLQYKLKVDLGELKKLEIIVAKVEELEKTAAAVRARLNVVTDLLKGRPVYPYFMSDFVKSVPSGVHVKTLGTQGGGSAATPLKLNISAEARTNEDIALWVRKMEDSGRFSQAELGPVTAPEAVGGEKIYSFTLTATYVPSL
jgi:Tfp pilus assembly protein PilN